MKTSLLPRLAAGVALIGWTAGQPHATAQTLETVAGPLRASTDRTSGRVTVRFKDRPVMVYAFATNQWKPYVKELRTLQGDDVLLDAPPDHLHHHGLMFAIAVNGINFWEEVTNPGVQRPAGPPSVEAGGGSGSPATLTLRQAIQWVANSNRWVADSHRVALLEEDRTLTLRVDETTDEVALRWHGDFTVGPAAPVAQLSGAVYYGLGLRLAHPFDRVATRLNSENTPYTAPNAGNEATVAAWTAMTQAIAGRDVTVAMFARPENAGRSVFFSMLNGFAYISATQELDRAPLAYRQGETFALDYLVIVRDRRLTAAELTDRYAAWLKEKP